MEAFLSYEDMVRYLNRTVCMYNGVPVYVSANTDTLNTVQIEDLTTRKRQYVKVEEEGFSTFPFELGFMNTKEGALYASRSGSRLSVRGLSVARIFTEKLGEWEDTKNLGLPFNQGFVDCLNNKYPSYQEALALVNEQDKVSCAFHKHYALKWQDDEALCLFISNVKSPIGVFNSKTRVFDPYLGLSKCQAILNLAKKSGVIK